MISIQNQFKVSAQQDWKHRHHAEAVSPPIDSLHGCFFFHRAYRTAHHTVWNVGCLCVLCLSGCLHLEWFNPINLMFDAVFQTACLQMASLHNPLHAGYSAPSCCTSLEIDILWSVVENSIDNVVFLIKLYLAISPGPSSEPVSN